MFYVMEIFDNNPRCDVVLICGKTYKGFLRFEKNIDLRVELLNGLIQSIECKKDLSEENSRGLEL